MHSVNVCQLLQLHFRLLFFSTFPNCSHNSRKVMKSPTNKPDRERQYMFKVLKSKTWYATVKCITHDFISSLASFLWIGHESSIQALSRPMLPMLQSSPPTPYPAPCSGHGHTAHLSPWPHRGHRWHVVAVNNTGQDKAPAFVGIILLSSNVLPCAPESFWIRLQTFWPELIQQ